MKKGAGTFGSNEHSDATSKLHGQHQVEQAERKLSRREMHWTLVKNGITDRGTPADFFPSNFLDLGLQAGYSYRRDELGCHEADGRSERRRRMAWMRDSIWYHQVVQYKGEPIARMRKVKDRAKLGKADRRGRRSTDVARRTFELTPCCSRTVQRLLEQGRVVEVKNFLGEIAAEAAREFEAIFGRKVGSVAVHLDSGHLHWDFWHCGISEAKDSTIPAKVFADGRVQKEGVRRDYHRFVEHAVGPGTCAWQRHYDALAGTFGIQSAAAIMGQTSIELERNVAKQRKRAEPRDLKMQRWLDDLASRKLERIDFTTCKKARTEYAEALRVEYAAERIGVVKAAVLERRQLRDVLEEARVQLTDAQTLRRELAQEVETMRETIATIPLLAGELSAAKLAAEAAEKDLYRRDACEALATQKMNRMKAERDEISARLAEEVRERRETAVKNEGLTEQLTFTEKSLQQVRAVLAAILKMILSLFAAKTPHERFQISREMARLTAVEAPSFSKNVAEQCPPPRDHDLGRE
jgi:hypothetical protein